MTHPTPASAGPTSPRWTMPSPRMCARATPSTSCSATAAGRPAPGSWPASSGGRIPAFTLVMTQPGCPRRPLLPRAASSSKVVTAYSGNSFPTYTPNPIFRQAYESGAVEVEHWSILTLAQRMEAAARGLPAMVTGSLAGSSMAENEGFSEVDSPFGAARPPRPAGARRGAASMPRWPIREGNLALLRAAARGGLGGLGRPARRGGHGGEGGRRPATVSGTGCAFPAHRVLAVVEAPFGAHPGGCYAPGLPVRSYGEDIAFWNVAAEAAAKGTFDAFADEWVLRPTTHDDYLAPPRAATICAGSRAVPIPLRGRPTPKPSPVPEDPSRHAVGAGGGLRGPRGRASRGRRRGGRRAGRGRGGQPGRLGGGGTGPRRREPGAA